MEKAKKLDSTQALSFYTVADAGEIMEMASAFNFQNETAPEPARTLD